ncbi:hypothetical protein HHI36_013837 [Cryptolaemus montrouzieri]|uniref:DNA ligase n=1 Tax=Cryptolaemus montrouzieri TaxID=559131 RepID=A0ABD2N0P4_9CUCU
MAEAKENDFEEDNGKDFAVEVAKQGRATCKKCKGKCLKDELRIAKLVHNPFGEGKMKTWHHLECLFEQFLKQRPTTKRIESIDDVDGFDSLPSNFQKQLLQRIEKSNEEIREKYGMKAETSPKKKKAKKETATQSSENSGLNVNYRPYPFREFRKLIAEITNVNSYLEKSQIVSDLFKKGTNGTPFEGNIYLWCRLLLPGVVKRIYNLQSKQLVKIFSKLFRANQTQMLQHLEQGDIGETIQHFYETSLAVKPLKKSNLTVEEVDEFLEELSKLTREEEQAAHFQSILKQCTSNDLKIIIRLIKHDLRMNAGAKHILDGVHPDAYEAYQSLRDLHEVIRKCLLCQGKQLNSKKSVNAGISVMTPVLPMLAEACKSVEDAMKKCPNGMYSEIKYDGERVQVHKMGTEFKYFSRSLKPVLQHKIAHFKDFIPIAFPSGDDLILDSEILMIDMETQAPLPFGSLGKHKRDEYQNACVCLYVFDCMYYNGEDLTKKPIQYRKKILSENMTEVKNHIVFSESKIIHKQSDLREMMIKVFKLGLEGLVLKDLQSIYEPGKRHWLKVKKDYLFDGAMADTADLIVLGAWYGTGKKGGKMSVFLMGCYDEKREKYCTVTKVHTGIDDKTLDELQEQLQMIKISSNASKVPSWLLCNRPMVPDFVAEDPKNQPVWEITGAEFTQHEVHTADGISIRFPRVTRMRYDKNWKTATTLIELKKLFQVSKTHTNISLLEKDDGNISNTSMSEEKGDKDENTSLDSTSDCSSNNSRVMKLKRKLSGSPNYAKKKKKPLENSQNVAGNDKHASKFEEANVDSPINETMNLSNLNNFNSDSEVKTKRQSQSPNNNQENKKLLKMYDEPKISTKYYFQGVKLFLEEEVKNLFKNWNQDSSLFSGILLKDGEAHKATHVLHMNRFVKEINRDYPKEARHVIFQWLEDTVKYDCLQDFQLYTVKWRPDL